jgi:4-hydroxyphenylacetaldehyde oxime monooxygenase
MTLIYVLLSLPQQWKLILMALVCVICLRVWTWSLRGWSKKLPPGPAPLPFLGNLHHQLGRLPHRALRDLARIHGPVMQLRLGTTPTVVMSTAAAAWAALKEHDLDCCTRPVSPGPKLLTYGLKNVAFSPYGAYWRQTRKLLVEELLSARRVKAAWFARQEIVGRNCHK